MTTPARTAPGAGALQLAAVRVALAPVEILGERLVDHPETEGVRFVLAVFAG